MKSNGVIEKGAVGKGMITPISAVLLTFTTGVAKCDYLNSHWWLSSFGNNSL